ncbi:TetR/AcrR family transcriptional regulator [Kamptonema cortianum]|nr:TetR/AcrR family transcriptional regulator [Geitlerinema splendidum]MDK3161076.1 TetR/AcrR family transcriptional regulator [Kamptonema cortianum]
MSVGRPRTFSESDAVTAAMELFWAQGYEPTGMTQLLDHLGMARQSVYNTFGDKRSLYLRSLSLYTSRALEEFERRLTSGPTAYDGLCEAILSQAEVRDPLERHGCMAVNAAAEFGVSDEDVKEAVSVFWISRESAIQKAVHKCIAEGDLPPGLDDKTAAASIHAMLTGMAVMKRAGRPEHQLRALATAALEALPANASF